MNLEVTQFNDGNIPQMQGENSESILAVDNSQWAAIMENVIKNVAFKNNKKDRYLFEVVAEKFTNNGEFMPTFNFPLTKYFIIMLSTLYSDRTILPAIDPANEILDPVNVLFALDGVQQNVFLHETSHIRINNSNPETCMLNSINIPDIMYDINYETVLLRVKQRPKQKSIFEYFAVTPDKRCKYYTLESDSMYSASKIDWDKLDEQTIKSFNIVERGILPAMPIVPLFFNDDKTPSLSPVVVADEILNVLMMFGLAGMPSSMLVKWYITKMGNIKGTSKETQKSLFDMLEAITLNVSGGTKEEIGTVDTGNGESFKNFMILFEAIVSWLGQMMGISKTTLKSQLREVRQAAASKFVEGKGSDIYRSHLIILFNEFEQRLFKTIAKFYPKLDIKKMKPIDKDNISLLADSGDLMQYLIEGVREKFIPYIEAIAKQHGITREEALIKAKEIQDEFEKYIKPDMEMQQNQSSDKKIDSKSKFGLKKGNIKGKIVKEGGGNGVEDKGGAA